MAGPRPDPDAERDPKRVGAAAAQAAASSGASREQVRQAAEAGARSASDGRLTEAELDYIVDGIVERFDHRGAFGPGGETPAGPPEPAAEPGPAAGAGDDEVEPRKRTFAERFVGRV